MHVNKNINSINKNFGTFKNLYSKLNCTFSVTCFSETWVTDNSICNDSSFQIENYIVLHQVRESCKRGGLNIFVHKEVYFKPRTDLSINSNDIGSLCIKIHHKKEKNILFSVMYRPLNGDMTVFEKFCEKLLSANDKTSKNIIFAGDLNISVLDHKSIKKVQHFSSSMFQYNMIPTIYKPTRVTRNTATAIDHIITNTVISGIQHRSCIIKTDILDHFPILFALNTCERSKPEDKAQFIYKRIYGEEPIALFKHELGQIKWNNIIKTLDNPNTVYKNFFNTFLNTYDKYFPTIRIKIKAKTIQNPWITKVITKSSKKKQKLYERFLKNRTPQNEQKYKTIKIFSKQLQRKQRKYTNPTNYFNVPEILKKHGML